MLFEPAEIASLALPDVIPFVGLPLAPSIETLGCDERDCDWAWERLLPTATTDGWQRVGSRREYHPSEEDCGARLRVRVCPPTPGGPTAALALPLLERLAEASARVEVLPPRPSLARRVHAMREGREGGRDDGRGGARGGQFRVLSYNLLADCFSRHWNDAGSVHSYCAPQLTRPAHRVPRLLGEVLAFSPDVVLLQEVDRSSYRQYWAPTMRSRGYVGVYSNKRGPSSSEGVASFVRASTFAAEGLREVPLAIEPSSAPRSCAPLVASHAGLRDGIRQLPTVAQALLLRETAPPHRRLLVANTHLYFSNPAMHVRLLQTAKLLEEMHSWVAELRAAEPAAAEPALIVAGDLNSDASDAVIRLLTRGRVEADDPDWLHGALNWAPSLEVASAARDAAHAAAVALSKGRDPAATDTPTGVDGVEGAWSHLLRWSAGSDPALPGCTVAPTLDGARRAARERHLLRAAVDVALASRAQEQHPRNSRSPAGQGAKTGGSQGAADAGAATAKGSAVTRLADSILSDAAEGRTLLDSPALAAAEVARQLRLPLADIAVSAGYGVPAVSWYTRAHTRLDDLARQIIGAKFALRARVASEASTATSAEPGTEAALRWAEDGAGVGLSQPTPLLSAYSLDSPPTHVVPRYANTLDWIFADDERLQVVGVAPRPPLQELTRDVAMPSAEWPSDHVSLCCDFAWRSSDWY